MLDENQVISILAAYLPVEGYEVVQKLQTTEKGIDLIARKTSGAGRLLVEAKGETSSLIGSNRFGKPYTSSQVFDRVAKGFYTTLCLREQCMPIDEVAFAGPDSAMFRNYLNPLVSTAHKLGIRIFLVSEDHKVRSL